MTVHNWGPQIGLGFDATGLQSHPSVVTDASGDVLVSWAETTSSQSGIALEIFGPDGQVAVDPDGNRQAGYLYSGGQDTTPSLYLTGSGGLGAVWNNNGSLWATDAGSTGQALPAPLTGATGGRQPATVGFTGDTGFVVYANAQSDITISKLTESGASLTVASATVNTTTTGLQDQPAVAQLAVTGYLAVVWDDENLHQIRLTSVNYANLAVGSDLAVTTPGELGSLTGVEPTVAALPNGGFVVEYATSETSYPGQGQDIRARIYSPQGTPVGGDFLVDSYTAGTQNSTALTPLADGGFVAFWYDLGRGMIEGQHFDPFGARIDAVFTVATASQPSEISAATMSDGRIAIAWDDAAQDSHLQIVDPRDGQVTGTTSADVLYAGDYGDQVQGLGGSDTIFGGQGNDTVYAGAGADTVQGGAGNDTIYGEADNDTLLGQAGDDVIVGGTGQDYMAGGAGADTFVFASYLETPAATPDGIGDFQHGTDVIDLRGASGTLVALVHDGGGDTTLSFAPASPGAAPQGSVFVVGDVEASDVRVDAGTQFYIVGSGVGEVLIGGAAADFIQGGGGADYILGGAGADVFKYTGFADSPAAAPDVIGDFQHGTDKINFTGGGAGTAVNLVHGSGVTYVYFAPGGTAAKGLIVAYGDVEAADVTVDSGVTVVTSGLGGGDVLTTSGNTDLLVGGTGKDTFAVEKVSDSTPSAPDVIEGFQSGVDKIDLSAVSGGAVNIIRDGAWSYVVYAPDGDTADGLIVVHGAVTPADLGAQPGAAVFVSHASIDAALHPEPTPDHTRVFLY